MVKGIVIYAKNNLNCISPYLGDFFQSDEYILCKEESIQYDVGKWKSKNLLSLCLEEKTNTILFATTNDALCDISNKLRNLPKTVKTYYLPYYCYNTITSSAEFVNNVQEFDISKPRLEYLEFHAADHCNLNCKGCGHYSNLEKTPKFPIFDVWNQDMQQLKRIFWGIKIIRIMGGEPLLNPELPSYVRETRAIFPDADVRVVSNGLLVPKMSDDLMSTMKVSNCGFDITHYIPTDKMIGSILKKLESSGLDYRITDIVTHFMKTLTINPVNNEKKAYKNCISNFCNMISNGMMYTCPLLCRVNVINEEYDLKYPTDTGIRLVDVNDSWKLYEELHKPIPFCKYCSPYPERFEWEQKRGKNAKLPDVIVDEKILPSLKRKYIIYSLLHPQDIRSSIGRGISLKMHKTKGIIPYLIYRHYHK